MNFVNQMIARLGSDHPAVVKLSEIEAMKPSDERDTMLWALFREHFPHHAKRVEYFGIPGAVFDGKMWREREAA